MKRKTFSLSNVNRRMYGAIERGMKIATLKWKESFFALENQVPVAAAHLWLSPVRSDTFFIRLQNKMWMNIFATRLIEKLDALFYVFAIKRYVVEIKWQKKRPKQVVNCDI